MQVVQPSDFQVCRITKWLATLRNLSRSQEQTDGLPGRFFQRARIVKCSGGVYVAGQAGTVLPRRRFRNIVSWETEWRGIQGNRDAGAGPWPTRCSFYSLRILSSLRIAFRIRFQRCCSSRCGVRSRRLPTWSSSRFNFWAFARR